MPTTIDSAGITFNDATSLTSALIGTAQIVNGSVTAAKLGTTEQTRIAKAWVNFNGTLATPITPRASFNVSSVTKNGTGDYTVNFATPMADANYSTVMSTSTDLVSTTLCSFNGNSSVVTVNSVRIVTIGNIGTTPVNSDRSVVCISIFGN